MSDEHLRRLQREAHESEEAADRLAVELKRRGLSEEVYELTCTSRRPGCSGAAGWAPCPYQSSINDDHTPCLCCSHCRAECAWSI